MAGEAKDLLCRAEAIAFSESPAAELLRRNSGWSSKFPTARLARTRPPNILASRLFKSK